MHSEGYGSRCVCVSVKSHLTSGASVCCENAVTYSVGNEGQKICGVFSATAPLPRPTAPSLGWPYIRSAIITHMLIVLQGSRDVNAPCRKLSLRSSFMIIILGLVSSS